jgi:hypothetical protein
MAYTNGFDLDKVIAALLTRIGWREEVGITLDAPNYDSLSGRKYQDFHAAVSLTRLKETHQQVGINDADFSEWLVDLLEGVIARCLNGVFKKPEFIEQKSLFDRLVYNDQPIANSGKFVGVRFRVPQRNAAVRINQITLKFDGAKTFNLYLFHDVKPAFIWSQPVTTVADDQVIVIPAAELLLSNSTYKAGCFYLGYFQDDLAAVKALWEQPSFNPTYAFGYDFIESKKTGATFDKKQVSCTNLTYGLNVDVTSFRDNTESIIKNAHLFDEVIGLQMAAQCIEIYRNNTRSNGTERISAEQSKELYTDLNLESPSSDVPFTTGLRGQIKRELKQISESFNPKPKATIINAGC